MRNFSVSDLHCDLLSYLVMKEGRTPYKEESRCSLSQLKKGHVSHQALAVFSETEQGSVENGRRQIDAFCSLRPVFEQDGVRAMIALENASTIAEEEEPLENVFSRLEKCIRSCSSILYISLTWNAENRFGGGVFSSKGLKKDGEAFLSYLHGRKIAIDLSHSSDALAFDVINFIDKQGLDLPIIASHSNFRKVKDHKRNLPDQIAKEIIKRKGLIGINFFRAFVGENFRQDLIHIVDHALFLGGADALCFGADFFCDTDFDNLARIYSFPFFDEEFGDSGCYPEAQKLLVSHFSEELVEKISHKNVERFLRA